MKDKHHLLHYQASVHSVNTKNMQQLMQYGPKDFLNFAVLSNQMILFTDCNLWAIPIVFRKGLQATKQI
jgi:hypothetical protein